MRSLLILAMTITPLYFNNVCLADEFEIDECRTSCRADEESRDMDCPSPDDSTTEGQERPRCLQNSLQVYFHCLKDCHPGSSSMQTPANPEPAPAPAPAPYSY